jgi:hypothetical protein
VFEKKNLDTLFKSWPYNCTIDLEEGVQPPLGPIYNLTQDKLVMLHEYVDKNIEKGFIWHSKSLVNAIIVLVKKKIGFLWMCVDYHGLNWLAIKNWYPLPLISRLLHQLSHAKVYTKIDLHGAYNLMHIWEGDEWQTTFKTHNDHFEYVVMSFGLTNTPTTFQHLMNDVFREYLDDFLFCYINDIFIFSKNMEDNEHHVHLF